MIKSYISRLLSVLSNYHVRSFSQVLPMVLLLSGMSTMFFFDRDSRFLYRDIWTISRNENWLSSHHLTMAVNFSLDHHFLGFISRGFDVYGNIDYLAYNRFPPSVYALIKLATLPFGDDLLSRTYAARLLMLAFFIGAAVLAYLSLCRLTSNRWIASASTLIAFSSTQLLRFSDTVDVQIIPDLFGCILAFHGMVVFTQEGRFRQLAIKSCLAVLIGWHVIALLLTFILLALIKEIIKIRKATTVHDIFVTAVTSRYFKLGIITFGIGTLILAYNIGSEYYALNVRGVRQLALSDLPSIRAVSRRSLIGQEFAVRLEWIPFLEGQLRRIGALAIPFALPGPTVSIVDSSLSNLNVSWIRSVTGQQELYIGIAVVCVCAISVAFIRRRLLATTAILIGFCWSIPMYGSSSEHPWEALYYVGIPLFFFALLLSLISKWLSNHLVPLTSIIGLWIFVLSGYQISRNNFPIDDYVDYQKVVVDDFRAIRGFTEGKNISVPVVENYEEGAKIYEQMVELTGVRFGLHYYLSGRGIVFNNYGCDRGLEKVDFTIQTRRDASPGLVTPNNQMVFLYDRYVYEERIDKIVEEDRPVIQGDFDVYLTDDRQLVYISDRCDESEGRSVFLGAPIFLNVYPVDIEDVSDPSQGYEFNSFGYVDHFVMDTKRHVVVIDLPDYDIASISTGQHTADGRIWGGSFFGPDYAADVDLIQRVDRVAASDQPIIQDSFEIYLTDERSLVYAKEPCYDSDISNDFFVHVFPVGIGDLPEQRRQYGFDNLDFVFVDHGTRDSQRCAAEIKLPDYSIASISTGQYTDKNRIWQAEAANSNLVMDDISMVVDENA